MSEVSFKKRLAYFAGGAALGAAGHHIVYEATKKTIGSKENLRPPFAPLKKLEGSDVGLATLLVAALLPENKSKYAAMGVGAGVTAHDFILHKYLGKEIKVFTPLDVTGDNIFQKWYNIGKYSKWIKIDPTLPLKQKERMIIPLFAKAVLSQRNNPEAHRAIRQFINELALTGNFNTNEMLRIQDWFLYFGNYTRDEGLFLGHDRYRFISKLIRHKNKYGSFEYDCDDVACSVNQVVDYFGKPFYFILISQRPKVQGVNPLHHIMPGIIHKGKLYVCEGIKKAPIVPIRKIRYLFNNLKRVVIVSMDGRWFEYNF